MIAKLKWETHGTQATCLDCTWHATWPESNRVSADEAEHLGQSHAGGLGHRVMVSASVIVRPASDDEQTIEQLRGKVATLRAKLAEVVVTA